MISKPEKYIQLAQELELAILKSDISVIHKSELLKQAKIYTEGVSNIIGELSEQIFDLEQDNNRSSWTSSGC